MSKDFSTAFYHSADWLHTQHDVATRAHGLCERCLEHGVVQAGRIVHHIVELTPSNITDAEVSLNQANLIYLCDRCHSVVHERMRPSARQGLVFDDSGNLVNISDDSIRQRKSQTMINSITADQRTIGPPIQE